MNGERGREGLWGTMGYSHMTIKCYEGYFNLKTLTAEVKVEY